VRVIPAAISHPLDILNRLNKAQAEGEAKGRKK
jgi:hypothetical protein